MECSPRKTTKTSTPVKSSFKDSDSSCSSTDGRWFTYQSGNQSDSSASMNTDDSDRDQDSEDMGNQSHGYKYARNKKVRME